MLTEAQRAESRRRSRLATERARPILKAVEANVREQVSDGAGVWRPCSGCFETEDGQNVHGYPYSEAFGCILGSGCSECGGIGAVWDTSDYSDVNDDQPQIVPHPKFKRDYVGRTVRTRREMRNSMVTVPKGTIAIVKSRSRTGAELTTEPCVCCGLMANISRISDSDIEFVAPLSDTQRPEGSN